MFGASERSPSASHRALLSRLVQASILNAHNLRQSIHDKARIQSPCTLLDSIIPAAPDQAQVKSVSEEQLAEREEAIHGSNAGHIRDQKDRGDTVINEKELNPGQVRLSLFSSDVQKQY